MNDRVFTVRLKLDPKNLLNAYCDSQPFPARLRRGLRLTVGQDIAIAQTKEKN